jgi:hypothetical protein
MFYYHEEDKRNCAGDVLSFDQSFFEKRRGGVVFAFLGWDIFSNRKGNSC